MESTFLLSYVSKESCCEPAFCQPERQKERSTPTRFISHHCTCFRGTGSNRGVWHDEGDSAVCTHGDIQKHDQVGASERNRRPPRRPTGPVAENDMMQRSNPGHAGRGVPSRRPPARKLRTDGESCHGGPGALPGEAAPGPGRRAATRSQHVDRARCTELSGKWRQHGGTSKELRQM